MKKVHGGILICDVLLATAAIFSAVMDVFLSIEMTDTDTHRIKIANLCRFCSKNASSKTTRPKEKFKLDFERYGVNVEGENDFIHPPTHVCQPDMCDRLRSTTHGPEIFSENAGQTTIGQFAGTPVVTL